MTPKITLAAILLSVSSSVAFDLSLKTINARPVRQASQINRPAASSSTDNKASITRRAPAVAQANQATELKFSEMFVVRAGELHPSSRLNGLHGKRVVMRGFMARMEREVKGGFYLCPRPLLTDEQGGGTADLPLEAVFVVVRSAANREVEFIPRPLEVTGKLEVGNRTEADGRVTGVRLILETKDTDRDR